MEPRGGLRARKDEFKGGPMAKTVNPLKMDPTRTAGLRRMFWNDIRRRLMKLSASIRKFLVEEDAFGLAPRVPFQWNASPRQYQFESDPRKVAIFQEWLQDQIDAGLLEVEGGIAGKPWTAKYVHSAYRRGIVRGYTDVHKKQLTESPDFFSGSKEQFLRDVFAQPEVLNKVALAYTRAFEKMKGLTGDMKSEMSRILADGLAHGRGPAAIARDMTKNIVGLSRTRARRIARTEVIHAHAEGQLDAFEALDIEHVGAEVEWTTASDPCSDCLSMSGKIFTIQQARGLIPKHPNCRCCWNPVISTGKRRKR